MSLRLIHTGMKTLYVRTGKALARQCFCTVAARTNKFILIAT